MTDIFSSVKSERALIFEQLKSLVSFNSVHGAAGSDCAGAAAWVKGELEKLGFTTDEHHTADGSIALMGTKAGAAGAPTVLLYSHYDVVAAGNREDWDTDPFVLTEREHADGSTRWFGRGAADCKGNVVMHLAALRAVEKAGGTDLNLKVLIEGSEEQGGEGLSQLIEDKPELFTADAIMIADAGNAKAGQPTLTTSLRGGGQIGVQVDTLHTAVHSGQFGGAAPDAVKALMRAIDSLYDEAGRTVIDGVDCTGHWEGEPYPVESFIQDAQMLDGTEVMGQGETPVADLVWARPALTVTGFTSTPYDSAVNAVPATAKANINLRVPAGMDARATAEAVVKHLENHVPWGAHLKAEVLEASDGFSTDPKAPAAALLGQCLSEAYGGTPLAEQGMGGSIPLTTELQVKNPDAVIALYGVEDPKAVIHSANESVDPTEIEAVAIAEALFLTRFK